MQDNRAKPLSGCEGHLLKAQTHRKSINLGNQGNELVEGTCVYDKDDGICFMKTDAK